MTTFYANDVDQATIICPKCGFAKQIDTTNFKNTPKRLKAKCKCGEVFKFTIEFRKQYIGPKLFEGDLAFYLRS